MQAIAAQFDLSLVDMPYEPRYNIAPTQEVLTIVRQGDRRAPKMMRWGLVPFWAKDVKIGYKMINARGEEIETKPAFRNAFKKRRCLVIADGFYEWRKDGARKTPMYIQLKGHSPFAFAGLWEVWSPPDGEQVLSCAIVTCDPNELIATIHDRMPVILSEEAERIWLDPQVQDPMALKGLLRPFPAGSMKACAVSPLVNSVKNHGPECIAPV